jgi:hypothetical protein
LFSLFAAWFPGGATSSQPYLEANTVQASLGKTQNCLRLSAGFIKHTPFSQMEDFAVTCPLVPGVPHLISGSCSSPRAFGLGFLQTPTHDDALALFLIFGSANT